MNCSTQPPLPLNEPVLSYAPDTAERTSLQQTLTQLSAGTKEMVMWIGNRKVTGGGEPFLVKAPHNHQLVLGTAHHATTTEVQAAIESASHTAVDWANTSWQTRSAIFLKAAELLSGPWRDRINAATILGQSKSVQQAEVDAACELIDFWRWNVYFADQLRQQQPLSIKGIWNRTELRPLEGFILAISPFNFTSIAANLPTAPALMGNVVLWKPSPEQQLAASLTMELLAEAGLPPGVINMITGDGKAVSDVALKHNDFAGFHFTGSTGTFKNLWHKVSDNLDSYKNYPRIVGETGGKDFVLAHPSASLDALLVGLLRGAFEYQGQKCSAASRAYIPLSLWNQLREPLIESTQSISMGNPAEFTNFMAAVINQAAYGRLSKTILEAEADPQLHLLTGGKCDDKQGWFVEPTIYETTNPQHKFMQTEFFGPILTVFPYPNDDWEKVVKLVDQASPYGLTGAIFSTDRSAIDYASHILRYAAGNLYINDKPTGAVVGQQPFGGSRASGTNDKAGSIGNLQRWVTVRTVKEVFVPPTNWHYPHQDI